MNCKVCGTRLGILERWRYGDFCSEDHKIVFADDLENLDRQLGSDAPPQSVGSAEPAPPTDAAAPETEPEPAMAGFVRQSDARPHRPLRVGEKEKKDAKPSAERGDKASDLWRLLARKADQESIPVTPLSGSWPQNRPVILIAAPQATGQGPGGFYLAAAYPSVAPAGQMIAHHGHLPQGGLSSVAENFWGSAFAVGMPFVPAQPKHWVDDQGWHWISDASAQSYPSVENVLAAYPMTAPWAQWPLMAPGMGGQQPASAGPFMGSAVPSSAVHTGQQAPGLAPGPFAPAQPGTAPSAPTGFGVPGMTGAATPAGPAFGGPHTASFPGVCGGIFGGGQVLGWGGSLAPTMGPVPQGGPGYQWGELPPPFFSALVDLSHGIAPLPGRLRIASPPVASLPWNETAPACPSPGWTLGAELAAAPLAPVSTRHCCRDLRKPVNAAEAATWTALAIAFAPAPGLPGPRIPRRVAPPIVLPLGGRLGLARPAEPLRSTSTGLSGRMGGLG